ncbi:MAG: serine hydrolase [SAR324 cluster bacterium]|nr:serine hydrolase [SAR324 cluster bacterium]
MWIIRSAYNPSTMPAFHHHLRGYGHGTLSMVAAGRNPHTFGHPGAGGSIGWADPDTRLAVAITHNRMFRATTPEENPFVPIGEAVSKALGVSG